MVYMLAYVDCGLLMEPAVLKKEVLTMTVMFIILIVAVFVGVVRHLQEVDRKEEARRIEQVAQVEQTTYQQSRIEPEDVMYLVLMIVLYIISFIIHYILPLVGAYYVIKWLLH